MTALRRFPGAAIVGAAVVLQTVWLWWLGIDPLFQVSVLLTAAFTGWVGWAVVRNVVDAIDDLPSRAALSFLSGAAILTAISTVLFQRGLGRSLGLGSLITASRVSLIIMLVIGLVATRLTRRQEKRTCPTGTSALMWAGLIGAALAMSAMTIQGVGNAPGTRLDRALPADYPTLADAPTWGSSGADYVAHLVRVPASVVSKGLPDKDLVHRGVQVWALSTTLPANPDHDILDPFRAAKVLAAAWWFSLFALGRFVMARLFGLSKRVTLVGLGTLVVLAPINWPPFDFSTSSYRAGMINSSGGLYHNITQLCSLTLAMAAVATVGVAIGDRPMNRGLLVLGTGLLSASAWFKPSTFLVLAPAMGVLILLRGRRDRITAAVSLAILGLPIVAWVAYPYLTDVGRYGRGVEFDFLAGFFRTTGRFPAVMTEHAWVLAPVVLIFSFTAWFIPLTAWLTRLVQRARGRREEGSAYGGPRPLSIVLGVALALGILLAFTLVEVEKSEAGNLKWSVAAASVLAVPVLVRLITEIRSAGWRVAAWAVLGFQLWSGAVHLIRYVAGSA